MSDYPLGAKYDKNAPYNQPLPKMVEKEVLVSYIYESEVTVTVPEDADEWDIIQAIGDQNLFPHNGNKDWEGTLVDIELI